MKSLLNPQMPLPNAAAQAYEERVLAALGSGYPPGYPLLIAAVFPFVGHWELAGQLFSGSRGLIAHCAVLDLFRITEAQRPLRIPGVEQTVTWARY